jgi:uncharacterized membrane protein YccC
VAKVSAVVTAPTAVDVPYATGFSTILVSLLLLSFLLLLTSLLWLTSLLFMLCHQFLVYLLLAFPDIPVIS